MRQLIDVSWTKLIASLLTIIIWKTTYRVFCIFYDYFASFIFVCISTLYSATKCFQHRCFYEFSSWSTLILYFLVEIGCCHVLLVWHSRWNWYCVYSFYFKDDEVSVGGSFLFYYQVIYSSALGILVISNINEILLFQTERSSVIKGWNCFLIYDSLFLDICICCLS